MCGDVRERFALARERVSTCSQRPLARPPFMHKGRPHLAHVLEALARHAHDGLPFGAHLGLSFLRHTPQPLLKL